MTCIIMGPQGCGKGTQAKLLSKEYGVTHVSIGDVLRKEVSLKTEIGKIIEPYMREGKLIPLKINNELVQKELDENKNVLLDGYPRSIEQAKFLLSITKIKGVIFLNISQEESIRRLSNRLICTVNGKIFVEGEVSKEDRRECESLGGEIIKRDDDKPDAIKKRLSIYKETTAPLISFLKEKGINVIEINGGQPVDSLFEEVKEKAGRLLKD